MTGSLRRPLSFSQERLWFLWRLRPDSLAYVRPWALRLHGRLDIPAMERALSAVVARHAILRTTYAEMDGVPYQEIHPPSARPLPVFSLSESPSDLPLESRLRALIRQPFDLRSEPAFRPELATLSEDDHVLLLTTHHIGFDAWSEAILARDLSQAYSAHLHRSTSSLEPLERQYADFAAWQRRELAVSDGFQAHLDYWGYQFGGADEAGRLDRDPWATVREGDPVGRQTAKLESAESAAFSDFCKRQRATPFMVITAGLAVLLGRLGRSEAMNLGYLTAGRNRRELEGLVGLFVNTLPLQVSVPPEATFEKILQDIRMGTLEGSDHQDVPFERIVDLLQPSRSTEQTPLFNCVVNYRNFPTQSFHLPDLEVDSVELLPLEARYDLTLYAAAVRETIQLEAVYARDVQSDARISGLMHQLTFLLGQAVVAPERPMSDLSLVPPSQRAFIPDLSEPLEAPDYVPAVDQVMDWATRTPEALAATWRNSAVSYAELASMAIEEARVMAESGVKPGTTVALAGPRCPGRLAGMLGAWLRGAVILPLDDRLDPVRQAAMLQHAGCDLAFHYAERPGLRRRADAHLPGQLVLRPALPSPSGGAAPMWRLSDVAIPPDRRPDAAYLLMTSGTTGAFKSILGSHRGLSHFLVWQRDQFDIGPGDRSGLLNNLAFDMSLRDILTPLISGGAVCIPEEASDLSAGRVLAWLEAVGVTFVHMVPSLSRWWMDIDATRSQLASLRWIFFAGEPLPGTLVNAWRKTFPESGKIVNLYGPTETTLAKCWYPVPDRPMRGVQPIGSPLPNSQIAILSKDDRWCGLGEPGEIVIRTPFRSLGYQDLPEDRASDFVPNPWSSDPSDELFRTGDIGRRSYQGPIEYLGRADTQIKIRGVKVAAEEVEAELAGDQDVQACAVVPRTASSGETELVAYLVPASKDRDLSGIRNRTSIRLHPSAVPGRFVFVDSLPLTANGKVDRRALPDLPSRERRGQPMAPMNKLERDLLRIWARVLSVGTLGVEDNFFDLGGHSLLALQLFAAIERLTGRQLPVRLLFEAPTVRALAKLIRTGEGFGSGSPLVAVQPSGFRPPIVWVHAAGGHVLSYQHLARQLGPDQPFYALEGRTPNDLRDFRRVEELAADYVEAVRKSFPQGPYYLGGLSFGGVVAWDMARQLMEAGAEVAFLGLLDTRAPGAFDDVRGLDLVFELRERFEFHRGQLSMRPPSSWPGYLMEGLFRLVGRSLSGTISRYSPRLARRLAPTTWPLWLAVEEARWARSQYNVRPLDLCLTLFRAESQPRWSTDPFLGWGDLALGGLQIRSVPGTHASIFSEPNLTALGAKVDEALRSSQRLAQNGETAASF